MPTPEPPAIFYWTGPALSGVGLWKEEKEDNSLYYLLQKLHIPGDNALQKLLSTFEPTADQEIGEILLNLYNYCMEICTTYIERFVISRQ